MQLSGKVETYLLLRLERSILELRQQQLIDREMSGSILKWIDAKLARQCRLLSLQ